jgi:hypothetical protein
MGAIDAARRGELLGGVATSYWSLEWGRRRAHAAARTAARRGGDRKGEGAGRGHGKELRLTLSMEEG